MKEDSLVTTNDDDYDEFYQPIQLSEQVWMNKLELLKQLMPREYSDGYMKAEDLQERKICFDNRRKFIKQLKSELQRRGNSPTSRDQVEMALEAIVDRICDAEKLLQQEGGVRDHTWHIASSGHLMTLLPKDSSANETTKPQDTAILKSTGTVSTTIDDQSSYVTDLPFVDMIISHSGLMLSLVPTIPLPFSPPVPEIQEFEPQTVALTHMLPTDHKSSVFQGVSGLLRYLGKKTMIGKQHDQESDIKEKSMSVQDIQLKSNHGSIVSKKEEGLGANVNSTAAKADSATKATANKGRVNQIRGHGKNYSDTVSLTVTVLLDPPPHYILRPSPSSFPLATAIYSCSSPTASQSLPQAYAVNNQKSAGIGVVDEGVDNKSATTISKNIPMVGTGGHPGHYTLFYRNNTSQLPGQTSNVIDKTNMTLKKIEKANKLLHIMDISARVAFEQQIVEELADSCCIPPENIHIDEIRRLDSFDPRLLSLYKEHSNMLLKIEKDKEIEESEVIAERKRRKSQVENVEKPQLMEMKIRRSMVKERRKSLITERRASLEKEVVIDDVFEVEIEKIIQEVAIELVSKYSTDRSISSKVMESIYEIDEEMIHNEMLLITSNNILNDSDSDNIDNDLSFDNISKDYSSDTSNVNSSNIEGNNEPSALNTVINTSQSQAPLYSLDQVIKVKVVTSDILSQQESHSNSNAKIIKESHPIHLPTHDNKMIEKYKHEELDGTEAEIKARLAKLVLKRSDFVLQKKPVQGPKMKQILSLISGVKTEAIDQGQDLIEEIRDGMQSIRDWTGLAIGLAFEAQLNIYDRNFINPLVQIDQQKNDKKEEMIGCFEPVAAIFKSNKETAAPPLDWKKDGIIGCEISVQLTITEKQREQFDCPGWRATDTPKLLASQMLELDSPLRKGIFTRHIVDIRFKEAHQRRRFEHWADFWSHQCHPVFFGRSAVTLDNVKSTANKKEKIPSTVTAADSLRSKTGSLLLREIKINQLAQLKLISFMSHEKSASSYSLREMKAFLELPSLVSGDPSVEYIIAEDKWVIVGLDPPVVRNKLQIDDFKEILTAINDEQLALVPFDSHTASMSSDNDDIEIISIDGEGELMEMGLKVKKKLFRFQMENLNPSLLERLRLQLLLVEVQLENKMKVGLVDGVRLHIDQLVAYKERDAAARLYNSAKQMFHRQQRIAGLAQFDAAETEMVLTEVKPEKFDKWVREIKRDELKLLKVRQKNAVAMKSLRKQEMSNKISFAALRLWLIQSMISKYPHSSPEPSELLRRLNDEVSRQKNKSMAVKTFFGGDAVATKRQKHALLLSMVILSETKRTKEMVKSVVQWVKRVKQLCKANRVARDEKTNKAERQLSIISLCSEIDDIRSGFKIDASKNSDIAFSLSIAAMNLSNLLKKNNKLGKSKFSRLDSTISHNCSAVKLFDAVANRGKEGAIGQKSEAFLFKASIPPSQSQTNPMPAPFSTQPSYASSTVSQSDIDQESEDDESDMEDTNELNFTENDDGQGATLSIKKVDLLAYIETVRLSRKHKEYQSMILRKEKKMTKLLEIEEERQERAMKSMSRQNNSFSYSNSRQGMSSQFSKVSKQVSIVNSFKQPSIRSDFILQRIDSNQSSQSSIDTKSTKINSRQSSVINRTTLRFVKRSERILQPYDDHSNEDDEDEDEMECPPPLPFELHLQEDELALTDEVFWLNQVLLSSDLLKCLSDMPEGISVIVDAETEVATTTSTSSIVKEKVKSYDIIDRKDLIQFATVVTEVEPAWRALLTELSEQRHQLVAARKIKEKEDADYNAYILSLVPVEEVVAPSVLVAVGGEVVNESFALQVEEKIDRKKKMETMSPSLSHIHVYVKPPRVNGQSTGKPFCAICISQVEEIKIASFTLLEQKSQQYSNQLTERRMLQFEHTVVDKSGISLDTFFPLPPTLSKKDQDSVILQLNLRMIHSALHLSGLSPFNPTTGQPLSILDSCYCGILPSISVGGGPLRRQESEMSEKSGRSGISLLKSMASTYWSGLSSTGVNAMIRIWYLEADESKGELVGYVLLDEKVMTSSTRGSRTYPIILMHSSSDALEIEEEEKIAVQEMQSALVERNKSNRTRTVIIAPPTLQKSTLSLKVFVAKADKVSGNPFKWHIEIMRAHGLPRLSRRTEGTISADAFNFINTNARTVNVPLSSVVCEVHWRGIGDMGFSDYNPLPSAEPPRRESNVHVEIAKVNITKDSVEVSPPATGLMAQAAGDGDDKTTTSIEKVIKRKTNNKTTVLSSWVSIGCCARKAIPDSSADVHFGNKAKGDMGGIFNLPPIWTCRDRWSVRTLAKSEDQVGHGHGDWMPSNYLLRPHAEFQSQSKSKEIRYPLRLRVVAHSVLCLLSLQRAVILQPGKALLRRRLDMFRILMIAEEEERRCMAREELCTRASSVSKVTGDYSVLVAQQLAVANQFNHLIAQIRFPTRTLSRLRYFTGENLEGGGMRIVCQDYSLPSDSPLMEVNIVQLLYPEEEEEIRRHVHALFMICDRNLVITKVIELSVHSLKGYTGMGSVATDTRTAVVIVERNEDKMTICDYLRKQKNVPDGMLITFLIQVLQGLASLHEKGIIHRNLHADSVFIQEISPFTSIDRRNAQVELKEEMKAESKAMCRLGDFWFLRNPRVAGCVYSQGRADWGDKSTSPPEVQGGFKISTASDVYAFGLCVLQWARHSFRCQDIDLSENRDTAYIGRKIDIKTATENIMLGYGTTNTITLPPNDPLKNLSTLVPPRWGRGSWLQKMLRMCLQPNPKNRTPAKDILDFLSNVQVQLFKKEKKQYI